MYQFVQMNHTKMKMIPATRAAAGTGISKGFTFVNDFTFLERPGQTAEMGIIIEQRQLRMLDKKRITSNVTDVLVIKQVLL